MWGLFVCLLICFQFLVGCPPPAPACTEKNGHKFSQFLLNFSPRESGLLTSLPAILGGVFDLELRPGDLKQMWFAELNGHYLSPVENWPRNQWEKSRKSGCPWPRL